VSQKRAILCVAAAALLWSSGGLFIKLAPMPALAVAGGRSLVAALFYLAVLRPNLRKARFTTALAYAGCIVTFVAATKLTTSANAIFLQYTGPAYVLMLGPWLLDEPFRRIDAACVALSLAGMSLFFVGKVEAGQFTGNLIAALSGIFFAFTIVLLRRDAKRGNNDAMPSTTLGNFLAAVCTLPFVTRAPLTGQGIAVLLYLGIVQLGFAYWFFVKGVRYVPAGEASLVSMLEPVLNPLWVFLGYGEKPGRWALVGGAIVVAAVTIRALAPNEVAPPADGAAARS
jgi:drug/metabolite transporter (DMT)-like permease